MSETRRILNSAPSCNAPSGNGLPTAVLEMSTTPELLGLLLADLERQRTDAERAQATAPIAAVLAAVLEDLRCAVSVAPVRTPIQTDPSDAQGQPGLLTPAQAAERLGVSIRWLYRHANSLPFVRRLTRRALRFDSKGLERWITARGP